MVTIRNTQTIITVHAYDKTWNEAEMICNQTINGTLYVEDSEEKRIVLQSYKDKSVWDTKTHVWIGLHYPSVLNSGTSFGWTDCNLQEGGFNNYLPSEPKDSATMKCVLSDKTGGNWITTSCDSLEHFVCETVTGTECTYDAMSGTPPTDILTTITPSVDVNDCHTQCLHTINNVTNCWAITYDTSNNLCTLYFLHDPFYLTTQLTSSGETTYIKNCYTNAVVTTTSSVATSVSSEPTQVCTEYTSSITSTASPSSSTVTEVTVSTTASPGTTLSTTASPGTTLSTTASPGTTISSVSSTSTDSSSIPATTTSSTTTITSSISSTSTNPSSLPSSSSTPSTTAASFSSSSSTTTTSPFSLCGCQCDFLSPLSSSFPKSDDWHNITIEEKVQYYVERLRVDKTILSSTSRKKSSAQDERAASKSVGYVSILFLAIILGLMVLSDLITFIQYLKKVMARNKTTQVMETEPETTF
ncbi:hypothetical protein ACF0H5_009741 [Mactra antiquata]